MSIAPSPLKPNQERDVPELVQRTRALTEIFLSIKANCVNIESSIDKISPDRAVTEPAKQECVDASTILDYLDLLIREASDINSSSARLAQRLDKLV